MGTTFARNRSALARGLPAQQSSLTGLTGRGPTGGTRLPRYLRAEAGASGEESTATIQELAASASQGTPRKERMERAFGTDLSEVRTVRGGPRAERALEALGANAVTTGNTIIFREANPDESLVAHELAHTLQQGAVGERRSSRGASHGASRGASPEGEARDIGFQVAAGQSVSVGADAAQGVAQFDLRSGVGSARKKVDDQRDKRGADNKAKNTHGKHVSFIEHDDQGPEIKHDHGFLDDGTGKIDESKRREAGWDDYLALARWIAMLEGAELLRPDLVDGTAAYRHFLTGEGATREFDYQRFIDNDSSGATVLASAIEDASLSAVEKHDQMIAGKEISPGTDSFRLRSGTIPVGGGNGRYPYPATENWQKAIGAHIIWLEMDVTVDISEVEGYDGTGAPVKMYKREFFVDLTLHAEDMYNFNPDNVDIATGTPDADNGRFEETGLGHEYLNKSTLSRSFTFETTMDPVIREGTPPSPPQLDRKPSTDRPADRRPYPTTR